MDFVLNTCIVILLFSLAMVLYRIIIGPRSMDRVLSLDGVIVCVSGILVCLLIKWHSPYFIDFILVLTIISFFGTVAFANYFDAHYPVEEDPKS
jgi:multicomponent Na+:H+ antiporter subunit F